jgi:membrane protein implicated in regulation of membrane protease activity
MDRSRDDTRPIDDDPSTADDERAVRDVAYARTSAIAGLAALVLSPVVVGCIPAAIGLHAGVAHLRFRLGNRLLAWFGIAASAVGAIVSAGSAIALGSLLLVVLLQRSALEQARTWEGTTVRSFRFVDRTGTVIDETTTKGRVVLIDCFASTSPWSETATKTLAQFSAKHPDVVVVSWGPLDRPEDARVFLERTGLVDAAGGAIGHHVAFGPQDVPDPLALAAAKPTLFVLDGERTVRHVLLGTYDEEGLAKLVELAKTKPTQTPPKPAR